MDMDILGRDFFDRDTVAVARDLLGLGMNGKDIFTSLETHMRCGVGKCGHCKVGAHYMCLDGPVFTYEEMLQLPEEF